MKRVGHLMERMMTEENFILAEKLLGKNKPDNRMAKYISAHAEKFGKQLCHKIQCGSFHWHKPKETTITDSYKGKTRLLKIPCLEDQAAQLAWLNIATPYIEKRNYYYNCGSMPRAGQTRAVKGLQKALRNRKIKYYVVTDIKKFYESCPHDLISKGLERIFKDKSFIDFCMGFVGSMSDTDTGIAIGYPVSHWLANVVLMEFDHDLKRNYPHVKYFRYMDDMVLVGTNKRYMRKSFLYMKGIIESMGMKLKKWSFGKVETGIPFLSYRFFTRHTILAKKLMFRIARRMKKASERLNAHVAAGIISYFGILKHCDSYNFRVTRVYPYINKRTCINLISRKARKAA